MIGVAGKLFGQNSPACENCRACVAGVQVFFSTHAKLTLSVHPETAPSWKIRGGIVLLLPKRR